MSNQAEQKITGKVQEIAKKVEDKVQEKQDKIWSKELEKMDRPGWMGWTSHGILVAGLLTTSFFSIKGHFDINKLEGSLNEAESDKTTALTNRDSAHKIKMDTLRTEMENAVSKASASAAPYNAQREVIIINGEKSTAPAEYILGKSEGGRAIALENIAKVTAGPVLSEYVAWGTDVNNINGRILYFPDETLLQSPAGIEAVQICLKDIESDPNSQYNNEDIKNITYVFKTVKDTEGNLASLDLIQDPGKPKGDDMSVLETIKFELAAE